MIRQYFRVLFNKKTFIRGSSILAVTTVASYILGLLRDRLFATTFGASSFLDAYNASFLIPDLLLNIFFAGALTAAFIPIFSDYIVSNDKDGESSFTSSVLNSSLLVIFASGIMIYFLIPWLSQFTVHGFDIE